MGANRWLSNYGSLVKLFDHIPALFLLFAEKGEVVDYRWPKRNGFCHGSNAFDSFPKLLRQLRRTFSGFESFVLITHIVAYEFR